MLINTGTQIIDHWNENINYRSKSSSSVSSTGLHSATSSSVSSCTNSVTGSGDVSFSTLMNQWPYSLPDCFDDTYSCMAPPMSTTRSGGVDTVSTQSQGTAPKRKCYVDEDLFSSSKKQCLTVEDDKQYEPS